MKEKDPKDVFTPGDTWQDDSSRGEDGKTDWYVLDEDYKWVMAGRFVPFSFFSLIHKEPLAVIGDPAEKET